MSDQEQPVITIENLHKTFRLAHDSGRSIKSFFTGAAKKQSHHDFYKALRGLNFQVNKGEFFGIVGRNGSGKSTLLKIIAGIYQPTQGSIRVNGRLVPFIELGVGFNPDLSGKENVYLNAALLNFSEKEVDQMYDEIVQFAELERFMDQKLRNYSSGMQVRLAFAMAIRAKADILLVDEVLAVGDADFQRKCFEYFKRLKKDKQTVVFVSHDMDAVREYCDRALLINNGKIACIGDSEEVAKEYTRLFTPVQHVDKADVSSGKWGAGTIDIQKVKLQKPLLKQSDEFLEFDVYAQALQTFNDAILPGFSLKNEAGQVICGTNSKIIKVQTLVPAEGEQFVMKWKIPNIFNEGQYTIEPSVVDGRDLSVCQGWDNAATFRVVNKEKTPYVVAPKIALEVAQIAK